MTANVQERAQQAGRPVLLVDTPTAMRMLSLGRSSILNLADRGELTRLRFGRAVRYRSPMSRQRSSGAVRQAVPAGRSSYPPGAPGGSC